LAALARERSRGLPRQEPELRPELSRRARPRVAQAVVIIPSSELPAKVFSLQWPMLATVGSNWSLADRQLVDHSSISMHTPERDVPIPDGAYWVQLTADLLASSEGDRWMDLLDQFEPVPHDAGVEMTDWLGKGVRARAMPLETWALRTDEHLLGFYAIRPAQAEFPRRLLPIIEIRRLSLKRVRLKRGLQAGLMLSSIVRADATGPGSGRVLVKHAIARALTDEDNVALFVEPANPTVSRMWERRYGFRPMHESSPQTPGVLWFPVEPCPEGDWP
jgi:hypothetical protein